MQSVERHRVPSAQAIDLPVQTGGSPHQSLDLRSVECAVDPGDRAMAGNRKFPDGRGDLGRVVRLRSGLRVWNLSTSVLDGPIRQVLPGSELHGSSPEGDFIGDDSQQPLQSNTAGMLKTSSEISRFRFFSFL
jgi:hypothetical protein